jgi:cytochrome oxidase Cu insertion factor (SCO1/SenC/PrrC family)
MSLKIYHLIRKILLLLALSRHLVAWGQTDYSYRVQGQLDAQLNAPASISLFYGDSVVSTVKLNRGQFQFAGIVKRPQKALLILNRDGRTSRSSARSNQREVKGFYLEATTITVVGGDSLPTATITGSPLTDDLQALQESLAPVKKMVDLMEQEFDRTAPEKRVLPAFKQRRSAQQAAISVIRVKKEAAFIRSHPNSLVSLDQLALMSNTKSDQDSVATLLRFLSPELQFSIRARSIAENIARTDLPRIGALAPQFTLANSEGRLVSLADYAGKVVLLEFGASWCAVCQESNPARRRADLEFGKKGFAIINVSLDTPEDQQKWLGVVATSKAPGAHLRDSSEPGNQAWARYHVQRVPQNFLIGPSGTILAMNLYGDALLAELKQLLH